MQAKYGGVFNGIFGIFLEIFVIILFPLNYE